MKKRKTREFKGMALSGFLMLFRILFCWRGVRLVVCGAAAGARGGRIVGGLVLILAAAIC